MIKQIILWPDKRLTQVAEPVTEFNDELNQFANDLVETMIASQGKGLAATQVGVMRRVIAMQINDSPIILVNPVVVPRDNVKQFLSEGCLSTPGIFERVERFACVTIKSLDMAGTPREDLELVEYDAVCALHETDHLNGVMFVDYISPLKRSIVKGKMKKLKR